MSLSSQFNGSQQFQPLNMAGSPASFGSFGDNAALGSSFGSIGECGGPSMSLPSGLSGHAACSARSPDARRQHMQFMQNVKNTQLGMSPSASGIRPSQGASPSHQFHIPGPPFQASPGSQHISTPGSQYITSPGIMSCNFHYSSFFFCYTHLRAIIAKIGPYSSSDFETSHCLQWLKLYAQPTNQLTN